MSSSRSGHMARSHADGCRNGGAPRGGRDTWSLGQFNVRGDGGSAKDGGGAPVGTPLGLAFAILILDNNALFAGGDGTGVALHQIEQAVRQQEERTAREETLAELCMAAAEVKMACERKRFAQHGRDDACGSGPGPLEEPPLGATFALDGSLGVAMSYPYRSDMFYSSGSADSIDDDLELVFVQTCVPNARFIDCCARRSACVVAPSKVTTSLLIVSPRRLFRYLAR